MAGVTQYTDEKAAEICSRMLWRDEQGKLMSLRAICEADDMPSESTVYLWLARNPTFSEMYARAREERAHIAADDIIEIADHETDPNIARVRIDARKWYAAKLNAKHYGDKTENTTTLNAGGELGALLAKLATTPVYPKDGNGS